MIDDDMDSRLHQQLLELHHGLLPEGEATELRARLDSEPELAAAWRRIQQEIALIAQAARVEAPPLRLKIDEQQAIRPISATVRHAEVRKATARPAERRNAWGWAIGLAAGVMLLLSLGGYQFHRTRLARLDREFPRIVLSGPPRLTSGAVNRYTVQVSSVSGDPLAMNMVYALYDADRQTRVQLHRQETDRLGRMTLEVSAKEQLPANCELRLASAQQGLESPLVKLALPSAPDTYRTQLTTDRPSYAPGDEVRFRSVTLRQADLKPTTSGEVRYRVIGPTGEAVSAGAQTSATEQGVGSGQFTLPTDAVFGEYRLVAEHDASGTQPVEGRFLVSPPPADEYGAEFAFSQPSYKAGEEVQTQMQFFDTLGVPAANAPVELYLDTNGQQVPQGNAWLDQSGAATARFTLPPAVNTRAKLTAIASFADQQAVASTEIPLASDALDVRFYPEGGDLVAGVENRVYFSVHDQLGRPRDVAGEIVDDQRHVVREANTHLAGRGVFRISPQAGRTYRLHLQGHDDANAWPSLPQVRGDRALALSVPAAVIEPSKRIEALIHDRRGSTPLALAAYCRGRQVGQTTLVTAAGLNQVVVDPGPEADGVLRLTVLDCTESSPRPVAERLVYRLPSRQLHVALAGLKDDVYLPEETLQIQAEVSDESSRPVSGAVLGIGVADADLEAPRGQLRAGVDAYFRLASQLDQPDDFDFATLRLDDANASREALELLLGTQGWRRFVETPPAMLAEQRAEPAGATSEAAADLLLWDNLAEMQPRYEERVKRLWGEQAQLLAVLMICGGVGLGVALVMAMLLRLVGSLEWSLPSLAAATGCVAIGVLLARSGNQTPSPAASVAFANSAAPVEVAAAVVDKAEGTRGIEPAANAPATPRSTEDAPALGKAEAVMRKGDTPASEDTAEDFIAPTPPPPAPVAAKAGAPALAPADVVEQRVAESPRQRPAKAAGPRSEADAMYETRQLRIAAQRAIQPVGRDRNASDGAQRQLRYATPEDAFARSRRNHYRMTDGDAETAQVNRAAEGAVAGQKRALEEAERLNEQLELRGEAADAKDRTLYREYAYVLPPNSAVRPAPASLYWHPLAVTDEEGKVTFTFNLGSTEAEYELHIDAHDANGRLTSTDRTLRVAYPVLLAQQLPYRLTEGDRYEVPVRLQNSTKAPQSVEMKLRVEDAAIEADAPAVNYELQPNEQKQFYLPIQADRVAGRAAVELEGNTIAANRMLFNEVVSQELEVTPSGYPVLETQAGWLSGTQEVSVRIPDSPVAGSLAVTLWLYPGQLADWGHARAYLAALPQRNLNTQFALAQVNARLGDPASAASTLAARFATPTDQASQLGALGDLNNANSLWGNYWSFGVLSPPASLARGGDVRSQAGAGGYGQRALSSESQQYARGATNESFGRAPSGGAQAAVATTDYGYAGLGLAPPEVAMAWSVANSDTTLGFSDYLPRLKQAGEQALVRNEPIAAGVVANGLAQAGDAAASGELLARLADWQHSDGSVPTPVDEVGQPSGEAAASSTVANTSVAALAWFKSPAYQDQAKQSVEWLAKQRSGGGFGSADDTFLALRALEAHAERGYRQTAAGDVMLTLGDEVIAQHSLTTDRPGLVAIENLAERLAPGENRLQLTSTAPQPVPYAFEVRYHASTPSNAPALPVTLATRFDAESAPLDQQVKLNVELVNRADVAQEYVTAEIGLPAGLEPNLTQLESLRAAAQIDHFETRPRTIIPYWKQLGAQERRNVEFDVQAIAPGQFTGPASNVYLLNAPQSRNWAAPLKIEVQQPGP